MRYEMDNNLIELHQFVKYDNGLMINENITSSLFPEQNDDKLGTVIPLWYLDEKDHVTRRGEFTVVRWDIDGSKVILVNNRLHIILVTDSSKVLDDGTDQKDELGYYVANSHVHLFPIQDDALLGTDTEDLFFKDTNINKGKIVRADVGGYNPQFVMFEGNGRVLTLDETHPRIKKEDLVLPNVVNDGYIWWPTDWRYINEKNTSDQEG